MRRFDKKAMSTVARANQLAEQRHIASRSLLSEGEMWDRDAAHQDTTDDTSYEDNWEERHQDGSFHMEEFIVYVDMNGEPVEYAKFNDEGAAEAEVEKLASIGVQARY